MGDSLVLAPLFTPEEFHEAVLAGKPRVAVFDCDGTLWAPDSGSGFMHWSFEQKLVSAEKQAWLEDRYRLYEADEVDEETICGEMVQVYAGLPLDRFREAAAVFFRERVQAQVFPALRRLVDELARQGVELWAVSSTCRWVVEAGLREAGFAIPAERVLAAEVALVDGILTDRLVRVPTGELKRTALVQAGVERPDAVFGNSVHDAAMMRMAREAYPVNASPALNRLAVELGWKVFSPDGDHAPRAVSGEAGETQSLQLESKGL